MSKGERIILKDDKGKQYEVIRVLDLDTKKTIDDLSALIVKKDKIIDLMAQQIMFYDGRLGFNNYTSEQDVKKSFEKKV